MPKFIDALAMKNGSTEVTFLTTSRVLQNLTLGAALVSVETGSTAANLVNYGLSVLAGSSTGAPNTYTLAAPTAGIEKSIYCAVASSSDTVTVYSGSSVCYFGVGTNTKAVFGSPGLIQLMGVSTSRWAIASLGTTFFGTTSIPAASS